jgi:acetyltransferase-like isoleucine patch superfamily enzyme
MAWLWSHRSRPAFASRQWWRAWGKRVLLLRALIAVHWRVTRLRHRGAVVGNRVFISPAPIEGDFKRLTVGDATFIGRVQIQLVADVRIGAAVCINDGSRILSASHSTNDRKWPMISKPIVIEDHVWIATGAIILPGVSIGRGAVIGAGAVVGRDVPPFAVMVGNPARNTNRKRPSDLCYEPVRSVALFDAWLN